MADVTISYKGNTIATKTDNGTVTLDTAGTFCEQDITVDVYDQYYMPTEDTTPYLYRTTAGEEDVGGLKKVEKIVGGTVNYNQIINSSNFPATSTINDVTFTNNADGSVTANGTAGSSGATYVFDTVSITYDHKYLWLSGFTGTGSSYTYFLKIKDFNGTDSHAELHRADRIRVSTATGTNSRDVQFVVYKNYAVSSITAKPQLIDLTAMFGSTIADYLYNLDSATAGDGLAKLQEWGFFTKPYYPYNAGELVSVKTSASKTVGRNLLDQDTVLLGHGFTAESDGSYYCQTASTMNNKVLWRNDIGYDGQISLTYTYKFNSTTSAGIRFRIYYTDSSREDLSASATDEYKTITRTSASNKVVNRISFTFGTSTVATWLKDMCICFDYANDGNYYAYSSNTYPIQSTDLRGILSLDASNKLTYTGDEYAHEGVVTRNYATYTFTGSENWTQYSSSNNWHTTVLTDALYGNYNQSVISDKFIGQPASTGTGYSTDGYMWLQNAKSYTRLYICNSNATSEADMQAYTTGATVVYPLATPTTESANPFTELQTISNLGTEQFVDGRTVEMPVGHQSLYNEPRSTDTLKS